MITEISENVLLLRFPSQYELCSTMLRPQEFRESCYPVVRYRYFPLELYMDLYAADHGNQFTYFTDWNGFNLSDRDLRDFYIIFGERLSEKERWLRAALDPYWGREKFYLIASHGDALNDPELINHELCHAWFYLIPMFRAALTVTLAGITPEEWSLIRHDLGAMGYGDNVFEEEAACYLGTSEDLPFPTPGNAAEFRAIFEDFDTQMGHPGASL